MVPLLKTLFRVNKYHSFVRQLNMYNFVRISSLKSPVSIFQNPLFGKGNPANLARIRRRKVKNSKKSSPKIKASRRLAKELKEYIQKAGLIGYHYHLRKLSERLEELRLKDNFHKQLLAELIIEQFDPILKTKFRSEINKFNDERLPGETDQQMTERLRGISKRKRSMMGKMRAEAFLKSFKEYLDAELINNESKSDYYKNEVQSLIREKDTKEDLGNCCREISSVSARDNMLSSFRHSASNQYLGSIFDISPKPMFKFGERDSISLLSPLKPLRRESIYENFLEN